VRTFRFELQEDIDDVPSNRHLHFEPVLLVCDSHFDELLAQLLAINVVHHLADLNETHARIDVDLHQQFLHKLS
jgi:hypothetical protein